MPELPAAVAVRARTCVRLVPIASQFTAQGFAFPRIDGDNMGSAPPRVAAPWNPETA